MKPIITAICLIGSFSIMAFAIWPEYQDLRESIVRADVEEENLSNIINYNQTLEGITADLQNNYIEEMKKMESGIPDDHYVPSLFAEIRRASYRTGVRIEGMGDFSLNEFEERPQLIETEISFQVEGSYSNFKNFVEELKTNARIMSIESIRIDKRGTTSQDLQPLEYSVTILTYSY